MPDQKRIFLMGPQGSGKGTQAELLAETLGVPPLSMGQLLRDEGASGSELGAEILRIINAGDLVSDEIAAQVLKKRLERPDGAEGFVLDGYPRNEAQYQVAKEVIEPTHVVVIEVPREESLERLSGRLTCEQCGKVYAMSNGYESGDACPCGGAMRQRPDDTPEAIERRLKIYEEETAPVVRKYAEKGLVRRVDGVGSVDEVHERIMKEVT